MAKVERVYNIPLRKGYQKAPRYQRTKKAVSVVREFLVKHMKADADKVSIGKYLNEKLWENGIKNPPHHINVTVVKDDEGKVTAELVGAPVEEKKDAKKEGKKKEAKKADAKKPQDLNEVKAALEGSLKEAEEKAKDAVKKEKVAVAPQKEKKKEQAKEEKPVKEAEKKYEAQKTKK